MGAPMATAQVSITEFAADVNLLNTPLWPKQSEILREFWEGDYGLGVWALGRRSGKTLMAAISATYAACMLSSEYKQRLRPGEKYYVISVANSLDQARIALGQVKDLISGSPILRRLIVKEAVDSLELSNGCVFRALATSSRSGRGMSCPLIIFDELSHAVDSEGNAAGGSLYQALAPSVAQFGALGKILMLSSPWIQSGIFWHSFQQARSGSFPRMQAVQHATWQVNPYIDPAWLEQERARDPQMFAIEFGAEFSQSLSAFLDADSIEQAINRDRGPLPPLDKYKGRYYLSLDPAKGNRDNFVAAIVHLDNEFLTVDLWHEFQPTYANGKKLQVDISQVEAWIVEMHARYKFAKVVLDQYNSLATIQRLQRLMPIEELTWTAVTKTQAYSKLRQLFNSQSIELYPHRKGIEQLKGLIVQYRANGSWSVSGGSGAAVDDYASALAGSVLAARQPRPLVPPPQAFSVWHGPRATYS